MKIRSEDLESKKILTKTVTLKTNRDFSRKKLIEKLKELAKDKDFNTNNIGSYIYTKKLPLYLGGHTIERMDFNGILFFRLTPEFPKKMDNDKSKE